MNQMLSRTAIHVRPVVAVGLILMGLGGSTGCGSSVSRRLERRIPPDPGSQWRPPSQAVMPAPGRRPPVEIPPELLADGASWTLEDVVSLALSNHPATRATWAAARSAAADLGSRQGAYYPQVDTELNWSTVEGSAVGGMFTYSRRSLQPAMSLNYMLFNFGKRRADVDEARQRLFAADWTHNAAVQGVILQAQQAFYRYQYAKGLLLVQQSALKEARANLDAAEQRRKSGLATVADVLQARTNLSQAELALLSIEGEIQVNRGLLATAMGLPADTHYDIGLPPEEFPLEEVSEEVDEMIREAEERRPDLAAARARALQASARARSVRAEGFPSLSLGAGAGRTFYSDGSVRPSANMGLAVRFTLFDGLSRRYDALRAQADAEMAAENLESLRQIVVLDVWSSYYDLKTAEQRITTSQALLESATESRAVAGERYQAGAGTILELLSAQAALEDARAQNLQARTDWFLSLAQLAYSTGRLGLDDEEIGARERTNLKEGNQR